MSRSWAFIYDPCFRGGHAETNATCVCVSTYKNIATYARARSTVNSRAYFKCYARARIVCPPVAREGIPPFPTLSDRAITPRSSRRTNTPN